MTNAPDAKRGRPVGHPDGHSNKSRHTTSNSSVDPKPQQPTTLDDLDAVSEIDERAYDEHLERLISIQVDQQRATDEAKRRLAAEKSGRAPLPPIVPLPAFLAIPDEDTVYRIDQVFPVGARVVLAAQYKAGKTTGLANLVRSLVDGEPFLSRFEVKPVEGRVVLIDDELAEDTLRRWLRAQGIRNEPQIGVVSLRGRASSMDILDASVRAQWARMLRGADVVILDCLRPVLDALGLDENHDAGRFLTAFDELLAAAGVSEAVISHHMGHNGERGRGDSRLLDWPDANWKLVRHGQGTDDDDPSAPRYFSAYGRDVDVPETALHYDPETRRLSLGEGSRKDAKVGAALADVLDLLGHEGPLSGRAIESRLAGSHSQKEIRAAICAANSRGLTVSEPGPRRAIIHSLKPS